MRLIGLKIMYARLTKPKCYGNGGNLSSMNCGKCPRIDDCIANPNTPKIPQVFWMWAKPGEAYPRGYMNEDIACKNCKNRPKIPINLKFCKGCLNEYNTKTMFVSKEEN